MNNDLKEISTGVGFLITSCIVGVVMLVFGYAVGAHNLEKQLDTQKEMLYTPTTKQQCLDGTQLGFDAYVKQHNEQNYSVNNVLLLAKARNADARTIAIAYSVHTEIDVAKGMLDTVVSHVPMMPKADAMELARKKREGWMEYCGTIA